MPNPSYYQLALQVGEKTGLDPNLIYVQWAHETNGFTSTVCRTLHNLGGLKEFRQQPPGFTLDDLISSEGDSYQAFTSPSSYATYFAYYITLYREDGIFQATTVEEYAAALKHGGYYGDPVEVYIDGMNYWLNRLYGGDIQ